MLSIEEEEELKQLLEKYEEICERLDNLNEYAFSLEQQIITLRAKEKKL